METPMNRVAEHQRRTLDFMLDALGLRHAYEEASRLPEAKEVEHAVAALETDVISAAMREREHALKPECNACDPHTENI